MRRLSALLCPVVGMVACGDPAPEPSLVCAAPASVVADATAWRVTTDADDVFGPRADRCLPAAHATEVQGDLRWHELDTSTCSGATLTQTTLVDLCADQDVRVDVWLFPLRVADGPFSVTIAFGDDAGDLAQFDVASSDEGQWLEFVATPTVDLPAGSPLWLSIANHGANTWNVFDVVVE